MAYNVLASVFASVRCYREVPLDMVPESPANIICLAVAGKAAPLPPSPFNVPADGVYARPPELSSFWIQRHFPEFEITSALANVANDVREEDLNVEKAEAQLQSGYRHLLSSVYPPSRYWGAAP